MERLDEAAYRSVLPSISKTACGTVYPLSIVEGNQYGEIFTEGDSVLPWHYAGFAFLFGACEHTFLDHVYRGFLCAEARPPRRFILFAVTPEVEQFFREKNDLVFGKRYHYAYLEKMPALLQAVPSGYQIRELDRGLLDSLQGRITPRFSWRDADAFLAKGKGFCVLHEGEPASWAFSAAVSSEEIDIGIETAEAYRKRGLGMLAVCSMIRYCFAQQKHPLWACDAGNTASQRVAEKAGFRKVSEYTTIRTRQ